MRLHTIAIAMLALGVAACTVPPEQRAHDVCTAVCTCAEVGTANVNTCVDECVPQFPDVSDDCLTCVYENSATCSKLQTDCQKPCRQQNTPLLGGMR